jgi:hypothetical protein
MRSATNAHIPALDFTLAPNTCSEPAAAAGAGATIQVLLFAIMAVEIKRKAPTCHTVLEVVRVS